MLSIICPSRNRSDLLWDCRRSATPLLRERAEFILVDDASTDETDELARKFQREFGERFRYKRLEKQSGAQVARNRGLESATGELVLFLDSDDVLVVPSGALFREGNDWKTFIYQDGVARLVKVEAGHTDGRHTEIRAGLKPGDKLLQHPPDTVKDGISVVERGQY
jgi:glycosyltransferase involved in cell wall biosynthesis